MEKIFKMNNENFKVSYDVNSNYISISIDHPIDYRFKWETRKKNAEKYYVWVNRDLINYKTLFKGFEGYNFSKNSKHYKVLSGIFPNEYHTIRCQEIVDTRVVEEWDEREDVFGNIDAVNPRKREIVNMGQYSWFKPETIISGIKNLADDERKELNELAKLFNSFESKEDLASYYKEENEKKIKDCKMKFIENLHYKYNEEEIKVILQNLNLTN